MLWRRGRFEELPKEGDTLDLASVATAAAQEATNGNRQLAAAMFREAIEAAAESPRDQILLYLQASGILYGSSSDPEDLNSACETIAMALGVLGRMNGDPGIQELKELTLTAYHRARTRRAATSIKLGDTATYPTIEDTIDQEAPTGEIVMSHKLILPPQNSSDGFPEDGYPRWVDGTTIIEPGLPFWNQGKAQQ